MAEKTRNAILNAAGSCFARYGYEKTTLDDIARIVGINKASFYYYFKNKEQIFTSLIKAEADGYIEHTIKAADSVPGCRERVLAWISESFRYTESNSILRQLSEDAMRRLHPVLNELVEYSRDRGSEYLAETLKRFMKQGQIKDINAAQTARMIQDVTYALKNYYQREPDMKPEALRQAVLDAVSLIMDGIVI